MSRKLPANLSRRDRILYRAGRRLAWLRKIHRMSLRDMSEATGMFVPTYCAMLEAGKHNIYEYMDALADIMGHHPEYILLGLDVRRYVGMLKRKPGERIVLAAIAKVNREAAMRRRMAWIIQFRDPSNYFMAKRKEVERWKSVLKGTMSPYAVAFEFAEAFKLPDEWVWFGLNPPDDAKGIEWGDERIVKRFKVVYH